MNALFVLYALACIGFTVWAYRDPRFDFRGAGRLRSRGGGPVAGGEEDDFADARAQAQKERRLAAQVEKLRRRLERLQVDPRADFTVLLALGGGAALLTGAGLGFLAPLALETMGGGAQAEPLRVGPDALRPPTDLAGLSYAADLPLGRLSQVVGGICGALVALRMLRIFFGVAALAALVIGALAALNFVIGRPALALFGA
ncbi:MAG: hypothetical protein AAF909_05625 [Pseudomonadota bacterium]